MGDIPKRKLVQTVLDLHPERRVKDRGGQSPYFVRNAQSSNAPDRFKGDTNSGSSNSQETEGVELTSPSSTQEDASTSQASLDTVHLKPISSRDTKLKQRETLKQIAEETVSILVELIPHITSHAPPKGYPYFPPDPPHLHQKYCPEFPSTVIRVLDEDTYDAAIGLANCSRYVMVHDKRPVCVLNMANAYSAGGGWKRGALAQEEALCYRSSLSFTLKLRYYPLPEFGAIYSPRVVIFRENMKKGHSLMDLSQPKLLPVVSVVSAAALCVPKLETLEDEDQKGIHTVYRDVYRDPNDREIMKEKMRVILRTAAFNGHRRLVLGAFGCGAFLNPREEVADCWAEVFDEQEFGGGWWESVIFAVMDDTGEGKEGNGNFGVFCRKLDMKMV